ncbi:peptidase [Microvirga brassicacearum]|uniref:Peptidase n=1 Tax=Microvirga brassicacearum TaxID=2580413 RepID=A0A5N3PBG7_9HYPH|nr:peptidase [Microvirga brassicacearum]KAB0267069.1 peptidase [Microvirga brassicacearum]
MTYCVGILVREGLVMIADTRTNAGVDNIAIFRKLHLFEVPGERMITLATAGNLSISQSVLSLLSEGIEDPQTGELETLFTVPTMVKASRLVGRAIRQVYAADGADMEMRNMSFDVTLLLGGQILGGDMRLFQIYAAGNAIEATDDTPFLQIGEPKYGKPILDRAIAHDTAIVEALKLGLISMDSTLKSNLGVGLPIDIVVAKRDALRAGIRYRIEEDEPYFRDLRDRWSSALRAAHQAIPRPPYADEGF